MRLWIVAVSLTLLSGYVSAETPEEKGLSIAVEADRRDSGFGDFTAHMTMTLSNRQGEKSVRKLRVKTLEVEGDGDKSLSIFDEPRDVKGTAMLTFSHALKPDEQWLYLPALKRVKRISSKNKSGPFMGSEFAYEDLSSQEVEKYSYKYLRDEEINGLDSFVVERIPAYKYSGYSRMVVWLDKEHYRPQKIAFFDRKNKPLKTLLIENYQQYLDKYWRADRMLMQNHQTGKSTLLAWRDYRFRTGLSDRDFNKNTLKRAR